MRSAVGFGEIWIPECDATYPNSRHVGELNRLLVPSCATRRGGVARFGLAFSMRQRRKHGFHSRDSR